LAALGLAYRIPASDLQLAPTVCVHVESLPSAVVAEEPLPAEELAKSLLLMATTPEGVYSVRRFIWRKLANRACHAAVKFGQELSGDERDRIMRRLCQCRLPFQCAHGRPTMVPLARLQSARSIR